MMRDNACSFKEILETSTPVMKLCLRSCHQPALLCKLNIRSPGRIKAVLMILLSVLPLNLNILSLALCLS